jgi:hypothetical protein
MRRGETIHQLKRNIELIYKGGAELSRSTVKEQVLVI